MPAEIGGRTWISAVSPAAVTTRHSEAVSGSSPTKAAASRRLVRPRGAVGDTYRTDVDVRVERGLERGVPEPAAGSAPAPGAAFGEDHHPGTAAQRPRDVAHGRGQSPQPVAVDEQRAAEGGERAEHRPAPDLALGEHPAGEHGGDERYVQPRDVVRDNECAGARLSGRRLRPADHPYPYAERTHHPVRPPPDQPVPRGLAEQQHRREAHHAHEVRCIPRPAGPRPGAGRARGRCDRRRCAGCRVPWAARRSCQRSE